MSHVTATVKGGSNSHWKGSDPITESKILINAFIRYQIYFILNFWKILKVLNLWILSTETSPMSHVTATVMGGSHSYLEGSDPKQKMI